MHIQVKRNRFPLAALALASALLAACGGGGSSSQSTPDPLAVAVDAFMVPYLNTNGITATTLTIMKNGRVLYEKAYGYKDLAKTIPLAPDALMTGASIVKPVTAAAIQKLAADGILSLSDKAFCSGATTPSTVNHCWLPGSWVSSTDVRIYAITLSDLIAHKGGWDRAGTACWAYSHSGGALVGATDPCDPLQHEPIVQANSGSSAVPTFADDIRFLMKGDLDFIPGSKAVYSNVGYMLLGEIAQTASNVGFNSYLYTNVFTPLGISSSDFKTGNALLVNADAREPNYITVKTAPSIYPPVGSTVNARNGAVNPDNFKAAATTISTARAMATFAGQYKIDTDANGTDGVNNGKPLNGVPNNGFHRGDLPGTAALVSQRLSGVSYAVLMNKNDRYEGAEPRKDYPTDVKAGIDAALAALGY